MSLKVEVQNISGLRGTHSFDFQEGLNMVRAPNAQGKTSLLNALYLIVANENIPKEELFNYLTENEITGYVKLEFNNKKMEVVLSKNTKGEVEITKVKVDTNIFPKVSTYLSYLRESSKLYKAITSADDILIQNWYNEMTQVNKFHVAFMTIQDIFHFFENKVDDLKERQDEDIEPILKLISKKENELDGLNKEKQEISDDPKFISDNKNTKVLNNEISILEQDSIPLKSSKKALALEMSNLTERLENLDGEINERLELQKNLKNTRTTLTTEKESLEHLFFEKEQRLKKLRNEKSIIDDRKDEYVSKYNEKEPLKDRSICPLCENKIDKAKMNNYLRELNSKINESLEKSVSLERKIKNIKNEVNDIKQRIKDIKSKIQDMPKKLSSEISERKTKKSKILSEIKANKERLSELDEEINKIEETLEAKKEERKKINPELRKELDNVIEPQIQEIEIKIQKLKDRRKIFLKENQELHITLKKREIAEQIFNRYKNKVDMIKKEMIKYLNDKEKDFFELLQLAELEKINFDPDNFKIEIQRANKTFTTLKKMSSAERSLITIIIGYIVKQTIIPDEPIFLIDEITSEMDETRFLDIINAISKEIPYLIVARPTPYDGKRKLISNENIIQAI